MLSAAENETITRVGSGTPMGTLMRRYWQPVLLSWELPEPDCSPVRVRILGEDLVAFRDTSGRVGLMDEFCPHRQASLWLGRNEENGLRCVFHGWKFDFRGACVEMPNELPEYDFKHKVRVTAYPTKELGGVIWAYMGPDEYMAPAPNFEWTRQPATHLHVSKSVQECNWLQALEGGLDSIHSSFLHRRLSGNRAGLGGHRAGAVAAKLDVKTTPYGYTYASIRALKDNEGNYVRTYHYILPHHQIRAIQEHTDDGGTKSKIAGHMWVPIDDENCMVWNWYYSLSQPLDQKDRDDSFWGNGPAFVDYQNGFRPYPQYSKANNWGIDRRVQKTETFTGIEGVNHQDRAVQESMGPIVDRSREHLGQTDKAITSTRRQLLEAVKMVAEGFSPKGADTSYYDIRAVERVLPPGVNWLQALKDEMYPTGAPF